MKKCAIAILLLLVSANMLLAEDSIPSFEGYVLTHVKKEMSPNWPLEALKAQAILARTFELKAGHGSMTAAADLSQNSNTVRAVKETEGLVLKYQGALASVFYHADSGGMTTTCEAVWGGKSASYLISKKDVFATQSPNLLWKKEISKADFEAFLLKDGIMIGTLISFSNIVRDESGRIKSLDIVGTNGTVNIKGGKLRNLAGLKSTLVNFGNKAPEYSVPPVSVDTAEDVAAVDIPYMHETGKKIVDRNKMPQDKQDRLAWFAENGIISIEQFMNMLAKPENIDKQIACCMKKLDSKDTIKQDKTIINTEQAKQEAVPSESFAVVSEYQSEYKLGDVIQFTGRGWGHGVGLPQWEAKAMAENGWNYTQILEYYFPGLTLEHY